jgi:hypothetical protein
MPKLAAAHPALASAKTANRNALSNHSVYFPEVGYPSISSKEPERTDDGHGGESDETGKTMYRPISMPLSVARLTPVEPPTFL